MEQFSVFNLSQTISEVFYIVRKIRLKIVNFLNQILFPPTLNLPDVRRKLSAVVLVFG